MGKRIIISESEKNNILSLYETTTVAPPPSESVLVVNKNPFKYPEFESARRTYSSDLKDGDMFYTVNYLRYIGMIESPFNSEFVNNLVNKKVRIDDRILEFINPIVKESTNFGGPGPKIGEINVKEEEEIKPYTIHLRKNYDKDNFYINFFPKEKTYKYSNYYSFSVESINNLYNKEYQTKVQPRIELNNVPDEYFEIRKIQRQQTDF